MNGQHSRTFRLPEGHSLSVVGPADASAIRDPRYASLIAGVQRLRARVYFGDAGGRHVSHLDESSWHVVLLDARCDVVGCIRHTVYHASACFHEMGLAEFAIAHDPDWSGRFRAQVDRLRRESRAEGVTFAQPGALALAPEARRGANALLLVQAVFALAQLLGDCLAVAIVSTHCGADTILRKLGAEILSDAVGEFPTLLESEYGVETVVCRFDSRRPSPRYASLLKDLRDCLAVGHSFSRKAA